MMKYFKILILLVVLASMISCGGTAVNDGENYGNLLDSPGGLILTQEKHLIGWGNSQCTMCHDLENIHLVNRTGIPIDIQQIHDEAIEGGIAVCADCHGTNGVE